MPSIPTPESLIVYYRGKPASRLNDRLAAQQKLSPEACRKLTLLHELKHYFFDEMRALNPRKLKDRAELKLGVERLEKLEFELQRTWGFPEDSNYHEWYYLPHCLCPQIDNREYRGFDHRITVQNCPAHGWTIKKT